MVMIKKTAVIFTLILIAACSAEEISTVEGLKSQDKQQVEQEDILVEEAADQVDESISEAFATETPIQGENNDSFPPPLETSGPDCYGSEPHEVGQGIAEKFPEITYEQVMVWFCNGAEFEDILVALQTEKITDFPAGEMLYMLADDWTWDEIWQVIGLTEE